MAAAAGSGAAQSGAARRRGEAGETEVGEKEDGATAAGQCMVAAATGALYRPAGRSEAPQCQGQRAGARARGRVRAGLCVQGVTHCPIRAWSPNGLPKSGGFVGLGGKVVQCASLRPYYVAKCASLIKSVIGAPTAPHRIPRRFRLQIRNINNVADPDLIRLTAALFRGALAAGIRELIPFWLHFPLHLLHLALCGGPIPREGFPELV